MVTARWKCRTRTKVAPLAMFVMSRCHMTFLRAWCEWRGVSGRGTVEGWRSASAWGGQVRGWRGFYFKGVFSVRFYGKIVLCRVNDKYSNVLIPKCFTEADIGFEFNSWVFIRITAVAQIKLMAQVKLTTSRQKCVCIIKSYIYMLIQTLKIDWIYYWKRWGGLTGYFTTTP